MKIYLIRHAKIETDNNVVQGINDKIVDDNDTQQKVSDIKRKGIKPDKIYCSELVRAKQTVELLFTKRKDVIYTPLLNEYVRPSRFIGKSKKELVTFWELEHGKDKYDPHWKPEDGESYEECANRAEEFYMLLLKDKQQKINSVAVAGHGTLFRHLACALLKVDWKENPKIIIDLLRKFSWENLEVKEFDL